jgi:tetratricopeptide (TPR) repeat protein
VSLHRLLLILLMLFCAEAQAVTRINTMELKSSLNDIDRLIRAGEYPAADAALKQLAGAGVGEGQLRLRRAKLAAATGEHETAIRICRLGLRENMDSRRLRLLLIGSLAAVDSLEAADREVRAYLRPDRLEPREAEQIMTVWLENGHPERGLALCDSLRRTHGDPRILTRSRAICLSELARYRETAAEYVRYLQISPHALADIRRDLRNRITTTDAATEFSAGLRDSLDTGAQAQVILLAIDTHLYLAEQKAATDLLSVYRWQPRQTVWMIQLAQLLVTEVAPDADIDRAVAKSNWLLNMLIQAFDNDRVSGRQITALQTLAADLVLAVLDRSDRSDSLDSFRDRIPDLLDVAGGGAWTHEPLLRARIRLAEFDCIGEADTQRAISDLDFLLSSVEMRDGLRNEARLALGRCHLARQDTSAARLVLSELVTTDETSVARLEGLYQLSLMDIAHGQWEPAREQLAQLALADPSADIANDALSLGLLLAELMDDPLLDPQVKDLYGRAVLLELLRRDDDRLAVLAQLADVASEFSSPATRAVAEQALMDLAQLNARRGGVNTAIRNFSRLAADYPDGRYPARALYLKGDLLAGQTRYQDAFRAWELLLIQYPASPQAEGARRRLQEYR